MYIYKPDRCLVPIKVWSQEGDIEQEALTQIENTACLPFIFHHVALSPDGHCGYGMPIGGIVATKEVIVPNMVGVDIGCGMCAVKTSLKAEQLDKETIKKIIGKIREVIPVGFDHHNEKQNHNYILDLNQFRGKFGSNNSIIEREYQKSLTQLGTLGGGNHFIEIQKDSENNIWIMIHSGSRNLGYKVAEYYNKIAIELNERWFSQVPKEWGLAFLPIESKEAKNYLTEMQYCVDFALANRRLMMDRIKSILFSVTNNLPEILSLAEVGNQIDNLLKMFPETMINIAHNYAKFENHFGSNVMVHRKGATSAREGEIGIIPGSQGSKSYIVQGLGNPESFMSCSHGAGRKMSRTKAQKELNLQDEIKRMDDKGIIHGIRTTKDLDEAAGAYKDIDVVMENQKDLVKILVELQPIAVIKG